MNHEKAKKFFLPALFVFGLVIAGIFFLQSNNTFTKAQVGLGQITGTIVLRDTATAGPLTASIALPGTSCNVKATSCGSDFWLWDTAGQQYTSTDTLGGSLAVENLSFSGLTTGGYNCVNQSGIPTAPVLCLTNQAIGIAAIQTTYNVQTGSSEVAVRTLMEQEFVTVYRNAFANNFSSQPTVTSVDRGMINGAHQFDFTVSYNGQNGWYNGLPGSHLNCTQLFPNGPNGGPNGCTTPTPSIRTHTMYIIGLPSGGFAGGHIQNINNAGSASVSTACKVITNVIAGGTYLLNTQSSSYASVSYACT